MTDTAPSPLSIRVSRREQVFPILTEHQIAALLPLGERRRYPAGAALFSEGDRHVGMFVLLSGSLDVSRRRSGSSELVITYVAGMFTGDVNLLSGRGAVASGTVREDSELLLIDEATVHHLMVTNAELSEIMMRAFILRRVALLEDEEGGTMLIGTRWTAETHGLRQFLIRNAQPHSYLDLDQDPETAEWLERYGVSGDELPVAITARGDVLRRPTIRALADAIGLGPDRLDGRCFDVAVIGAGPAGLAAAVYAASEGLSVVVLDKKAPGGQAGSTSKIENYFGFPTGITGQALAGRGFVQAQKFGAEVAIPCKVVGFECRGAAAPMLVLDSGEHVAARAVVIASGARYRKLELPNLESFEGKGIYYAASIMEARLCHDRDIVIVGGGNSAGQAAVYLANGPTPAKHVYMLVRSSLASSMSDYLVQRIHATPSITVLTGTEVVGLHGECALSGVRWRNNATGAEEERPIEHVFLFCGAEPNTEWLQACVALDKVGFVKTGTELSPEDLDAEVWNGRTPLRLETSHPGVFAVGDARCGSVKRVAAAVGEGSTAVQLIHAYLAAAHELEGGAPSPPGRDGPR
jgi:thioredoxin reductase (NADPH)